MSKMRSYSTRAPEELASEKGSGRQERAERGCNKRPCFGDNISPPLLPTRVFRPVFPGRVFVSLPVSLPLVSVILVRILRQAFLSFLLAFNLLHPLSISDTTFFLRLSAALPTPAFRARPSFLRFSLRSWLFPPAPIHAAPNLNPIFHITSRKSYSAGARRGRKQRATHGSRTKERRNIFIFSLLPSFLFLVFLLSLLSLRAVRSKTISEHIARVRLRSLPSNPGAFPAPSRRARPAPAAMSSRLFDPRGRRNNACTVARSHSFPLFSSFAVLTLSLLAFRHARNFLGEKSPSNSSNWPLQ